jgi:hypothetical protein
MRRTYSDWDLFFAVSGSRSIAQVLSCLGLKPAGSNYKTVQRRIKELGFDTSHLGGQAWSKGLRIPRKPVIPLKEILIVGSTFQSHKLKRRLVQSGLKEHRCERCGLSQWNERPIPLELHHLNGRNDDNRLFNLNLLCANCHAQTDTYRARNKRKEAGRPPYPNRQREGA